MSQSVLQFNEQGGAPITGFAFSVEQLADLTTLSPGFLRGEIRKRRLKAKKFGRRVLILASDWEAYTAGRSDWEPAK